MPFDLTPFVELEKRLGPERFRAAVERMCRESAREIDREIIGGNMKRKVESLHGLINVERVEEPPHGVFFVIREAVTTGADGVPEMRANMEVFVRESVLPAELRKQIREVLRTLPMPKMSAETQAEYDAQHAETVSEVLRKNPLPPCDACGEAMRVEAETERWKFLVACTNCGHTQVAEYDPRYELASIGEKP